ncbi:MAG TPA: hypothetical protein DCE65_08685, partial [Clostridiales bacterium]|nr:hypothetical protein [Clostridiales bacterium]
SAPFFRVLFSVRKQYEAAFRPVYRPLPLYGFYGKKVPNIFPDPHKIGIFLHFLKKIFAYPLEITNII